MWKNGLYFLLPGFVCLSGLNNTTLCRLQTMDFYLRANLHSEDTFLSVLQSFYSIFTFITRVCSCVRVHKQPTEEVRDESVVSSLLSHQL